MSIWLDVTTIWGWRRPALGVVRVEAEVARHFVGARNSSLIRFCRYDSQVRSYLEVSCEEVGRVLLKLDDGWKECAVAAEAHAVDAQMSEPPAVSNPRNGAWKRRAKSAIERLPPRARGAALRWAGRGYHATIRLSKHIRDARHEDPQHQFSAQWNIENFGDGPRKLPAPRRHPFQISDVYISLGLDWDQKDLVFLYEMKNRLKLRVMLCCYDIIPILMPEACAAGVPEKFPRYFSDAAWCADEVICISKCSLRDLSHYLASVGAPVPEMSVIRLGSELPPSLGAPPSANVDEALRRPFILYVSTIEARKNHKILCQAYRILLSRGQVDIPRLVLVGMKGWGVDQLMTDMSTDPMLREHIQMLDHVSDDDLRRLYKNSIFTVYPSLYEGWGLPVAESLACGKFCLASNAASIPEVGGDLVEYVDPQDAEAWARRLLWYFQSPGRVKERELRIVESYRNASWKEVGSAILSGARGLASI